VDRGAEARCPWPEVQRAILDNIDALGRARARIAGVSDEELADIDAEVEAEFKQSFRNIEKALAELEKMSSVPGRGGA
jgi:hypothetical protein